MPDDTRDTHPDGDSRLERIYDLLVDDDEDHGRGELPDRVQDAVPGNAARQVVALTLQKAGDLVVDAKTVLAWLLAALGAPASFTGLLVPIRESGSMLPQAILVPIIRRRAIRKWVWVLGGVLQAAAVLAMAVIAATLDGAPAGVAILVALALFALARSLSSIASKDVLGRTLPKGVRGQVKGYATIGSGLAAITVGLGMRVLGGEDTEATTFAWLLGGAAMAWLLASAAFATVTEEPGDTDQDERSNPIGSAVTLLRGDAPFRRFVVARTLLLVSALTPPFIVTLATEQGGAGIAGLGGFVLSSGLASLIGGRFWGRFADRSSRRTMMVGAGAASAVIVALLAALRIEAVAEWSLIYPVAYLLLALAHTGVRLGRKTYVVDLAEGNRRTDYVAVSNTAMGILLLATGGVTSLLALAGVEVALLALAVLGVVGVVVSRSLPEVSAGS